MRFIALLLCSLLAARADTPAFTSDVRRTHLLELYSSEGCSSCPPAEAWLGELRTAPGLWRDFVPVALHVNYWDRLGWRDRFASRAHTDRAYRYAAAWRRGNVYTPCFVLDGAEAGARGPATGLQAATDRSGVLTARLTGDGRVEVDFAAAAPGDYAVTVALLGGGIVSPVRAGENGGRTLRHEFVALALAEAPLPAGHAVVRLAAAAPAGVPRRALAVWVTRRGELAPVQATGGWLDAPPAGGAQ